MSELYYCPIAKVHCNCGEPKKEELTLEKAIDFLTEIGWLYNHDKELTQERPHGEWEKKPEICYDYFYCSECEYAYKHAFNFCPNCGADMRVKNELNRVSKELNSEIEKSKSEIVPDYRDGWRLKGDEE